MGWGDDKGSARAVSRPDVVRTPAPMSLCACRASAGHDRCARALADAVASYLVSSTTGRAEAMHAALHDYTTARKVLDA